MPPASSNQELRSRSNKKKKGSAAAEPAPARSAANINPEKAARDLLTEAGTSSFSFNTAFRILLIARCASALYGIIQDCDEVYNYWEPMHYLQYGYGMQTWEYSPQFGIRSWAYILANYVVAWFTGLIAANKLQVFFLVRLVFAAISSCVEALFYRTVTEEINPHVGRYIFVGLFFSAGMFNAATAFLPSSFAMWTTFLAYSFVLRPPIQVGSRRTFRAVLCFGLGAMLGWPFSAIVGVPFAVEEILVFGRESIPGPNGRVLVIARPSNWRTTRVIRLARTIALCAVSIAVPIVLIDFLFYRRLTFVPLNIVLYNVFGGADRGPAIYGTEPWYFYIINGFLNFNILFMFALASAPMVLLASYIDRERLPGSTKLDAVWPYVLLGLKLVPFYICFTIFTLQPHKEERFFYIAYPFVVLNAAISIFLIRGWVSRGARVLGASIYVRANIIRYTSFAILSVFTLISVSRIAALVTRYRAPIQVYGALWQERQPDQLVNFNYLQENYPYDPTAKDINVCVGKEWYRFPSSYFLPKDVRLQFVKSDFNGMLPKPFIPDIKTVSYIEDGKEQVYRTRELKFVGARTVQPGFNDLNKEDPTTYVNVSECNYLVDASFPLRPTSSQEPDYINDSKNWEIVECQPFLDVQNSGSLPRAFYVPGSKQLAWGEYCLLKKRKL